MYGKIFQFIDFFVCVKIKLEQYYKLKKLLNEQKMQQQLLKYQKKSTDMHVKEPKVTFHLGL